MTADEHRAVGNRGLGPCANRTGELERPLNLRCATSSGLRCRDGGWNEPRRCRIPNRARPAVEPNCRGCSAGTSRGAGASCTACRVHRPGIRRPAAPGLRAAPCAFISPAVNAARMELGVIICRNILCGALGTCPSWQCAQVFPCKPARRAVSPGQPRLVAESSLTSLRDDSWAEAARPRRRRSIHRAPATQAQRPDSRVPDHRTAALSPSNRRARP